jgi:hypothetical protein
VVRASGICLQDKELLPKAALQRGNRVPAGSHLQACCQSGGGREEYDLFDMAANSQIANAEGAHLDVSTVIKKIKALGIAKRVFKYG